MPVQIRPARPGDGEAIARLWDELGATLVGLDASTFRRPSAEGLGEWMEADLATRLLRAAEDALRERGAEVLFLDTHVRNEPGIGLFEGRLGYARRSIRYTKRL